MRRWCAPLLATIVALLSGCAPALRQPIPVAALGTPSGRETAEPPAAADVSRLLGEGEASFARRPDMASVRHALNLFLAAARADDARIEGLLGAARASAWLADHEAGTARRADLASKAVQACQWCARRRPTSIDCKYWLALALGLQARERRSTGADALPRIVSLLEEVIADAPRLDQAGGDRVLALVLLRAPGWPTGPGDPEAGLDHARRADELVPNQPSNLLVLGEALAATGDTSEARRVYKRAEDLARARMTDGDPDAAEWAEAAARAIKTLR